MEESYNPSGLCWCGCGRETNRAHADFPKRGIRKGEHYRYLNGHHRRNKSKGPNPSGLCMCGCGQPTPLSTVTQNGLQKGYPVRYLQGHRNRSAPVDYIVDEATGCWNWQLSKSADGYGQTRCNGREARAHRVYYERFVGPIPKGMVIHHVCENTSCVNPDHLRPVTAAENRRLSRATKLNEDQVTEIRSLIGTASLQAIADQFGVSKGTIWQIKRGAYWTTPKPFPTGPRGR